MEWIHEYAFIPRMHVLGMMPKKVFATPIMH